MKSKKHSILHWIDIDVPQELALLVEVTVTPGHAGYFNPKNGDCDPPQNTEVVLENRE